MVDDFGSIVMVQLLSLHRDEDAVLWYHLSGTNYIYTNRYIANI